MTDTDLTDLFREALVDIVNVLGCPRAEAHDGCCEGCAFESYEASIVGLGALGYLERTYTEIDKGPPLYLQEEISPDPLDAWAAFMEKELGVELPEGWKDK